MKLRPVGDRAVLAEFDDLETVHGYAAAARAASAEGELAGAVDVVPGYRTLLVTGPDPASLAAALRRLEPLPAETMAGEVVEIPVSYDGEDLGEVARLSGLSEQEIVERHSAVDYTVAFLGFTPGFPYLLGLDPALSVPRRASPRTTVPAGAVGLAGGQTGIYPRPSPGGWQLIGRTDAVLFDPDRDPPALLAPGGRLRFVPTDEVGPARVPPRPSLEEGEVLVVRAGPLTTVQDLGRPGYADLGVPAAGTADPRSARLANRLVGNAEHAAVLEVTLGGLELRFDRPAFVAVSGADADVVVDGLRLGADVGFGIAAGSLLSIGSARHGLRCYLAVRGGFDVPAVLGSRSSDTLAGLGPPPLSDGDRLPLAAEQREQVWHEVAPTAPPGDEIELRVRLGPRDDWLTEDGRAALFATPWTVSSTSDRTGLRLEGPALELAGSLELDSEGMVAGALQVPPEGRPILFLANHPTTGGYPVAGVVVAEDLSLAGQARPGTVLHLRSVPAARL